LSSVCPRGCRSCRCENFAVFPDTIPCASSNRRPCVAPALSEKPVRPLIPLSRCQSRNRSAHLVRTPDIFLALRRYVRTNDNSIVRASSLRGEPIHTGGNADER